MISHKALSGLVVALVVVGNFIAFQNCSKTSSASVSGSASAGDIGLSSKALSEEGALVDIEGDVFSVYEDYADNSFKLRHFVRDKDGKEYELKSNRQEPYRNGKVKIKGRPLKESQESSHPEINVYEEELGPVAYNSMATDNPFPMPASANAYSIGEQKTLLLLVNFYDNTSQPINLAQAQEWLGKLDAFIREGSYNNTWINGDVVDWVTIDQSSTICGGFDLQNKARGQAHQKGYDLTLYDRFIFATLKRDSCGFTGQASVGNKTSYADINGDWDTGVLFHEFGHNLGIGHAYSNDCKTEQLGLNCQTIIYGDPLSVMGKHTSLTGPYNPFHRLVLGWAKASDVIEVTANGVYNIVPYTGNSQSGAKILRIPKPNDPDQWFYINMHQALGMDQIMLTQTSLNASNITNGVVVREANLYTTHILDMTPETGSSESDWYDPALTVGNSFQDPFSGIRITTESVSLNGASVRVEFTNQRSCRSRSPIFTVPSSSSGYAGVSSALLTMNIQSKSSLDCGTETYSIVPTLPVDWTMSLTNSTPGTPPGGSTSVGFTVTPPLSAVVSTRHYLNFKAVSNSGLSSGTDTLSYYVKPGTAPSPTPTPTPVNKAPVAVNDSVSIASKVAVTIPVLANDSDPEGKPLKVTAVGRPGVGSVRINADNTVTYTPASKFKTSDNFSYTISDGSLTATATVTVTLSGTSGGSSPGGGRNK